MKVQITVFVLAPTVLGCDRQPQSSSVSTSATARPQRYQVFFSPHVRADTFLVDTQKGRVWVLTKFTDVRNVPSVFNEIEIIDNTGELGIKYSEFERIYVSPQSDERKSKKSNFPAISDELVGKSSESKNVKK